MANKKSLWTVRHLHFSAALINLYIKLFYPAHESDHLVFFAALFQPFKMMTTIFTQNDKCAGYDGEDGSSVSDLGLYHNRRPARID